MPVKVYRPTSPGRRNMSVTTFDEITRTEPERSLLAPLRKKGGPVDNYLTLKGGGREIELGAFLSPEERADLHDQILTLLARCRAAPQGA